MVHNNDKPLVNIDVRIKRFAKIVEKSTSGGNDQDLKVITKRVTIGEPQTERKIDCVPKVEIIYDMFEDLSINVEG